jgi:uncharacterized protein (TIGR02246 family)
VNRRATITAVLCLAAASIPVSVTARTTLPPRVCQPLTKPRVRALFDTWNKALEDQTAKSVTALYGNDATLLPTVEVGPYTKPSEQFFDYFKHFVERHPVATIDEASRFITIRGNLAYDIGLYDFLVDGEDGQNGETIKARYTFIYECEQGVWRIAHHHSSKQP